MRDVARESADAVGTSQPGEGNRSALARKTEGRIGCRGTILVNLPRKVRYCVAISVGISNVPFSLIKSFDF